MQTDELIAQLAADPAPRARPVRRVALAALGGWLAALAAFVLLFGSPMQSVALTGAMPFATKFGYPLAVALLALWAVIAVGRPGQRPERRVALIVLPLVVVVVASATELVSTQSAEWSRLFFGTTFVTCLVAVGLASLPVLAAVLWAFTSLAPTRLRLAGFLAGLSAGATAAVAYALYCPETTASFLIGAYTTAIMIPALLGALLGPRLLRW